MPGETYKKINLLKKFELHSERRKLYHFAKLNNFEQEHEMAIEWSAKMQLVGSRCSLGMDNW